MPPTLLLPPEAATAFVRHFCARPLPHAPSVPGLVAVVEVEGAVLALVAEAGRVVVVLVLVEEV